MRSPWRLRRHSSGCSSCCSSRWVPPSRQGCILAPFPLPSSAASSALLLAGETWNVSSLVGLSLFGIAVQKQLVLVTQTCALLGFRTDLPGRAPGGRHRSGETEADEAATASLGLLPLLVLDSTAHRSAPPGHRHGRRPRHLDPLHWKGESDV